MHHITLVKVKFKLQKKSCISSFWRRIPLPQFFVDLINKVFIMVHKIIQKHQPTDFIIKEKKLEMLFVMKQQQIKFFENLVIQNI